MDARRSGPVRVLIVDDHPMVREGLRSMLGDGTVEVVGAAGTGAEAIRLAREAVAEVILLDLKLPDVDGLALLAGLRALAPDTRVLVVTMHDDATLVRRALAAGAAGYVLKGIGRRELLAAVHAVHVGADVLDPALAGGLPRRPAAPPSQSRQMETLTPVEREVLRLVADGLTNREISSRLHWSIATTKKYVHRILQKLGVVDRTQAAAEAVRLRIV
jgi:DNA-binding NarL/FixJ family response regulator